ncbi:Mu transposase C-terminal domain-containing protein [Methylosinus sp. KRF6]|uniref:Mu transposase C-terminal domain-containing protein n=1 Tax=Methylosinus sp. KRF6 TaxID=2846853 RepID=UPI001C0DB391|nr:Mu transposase C-terminal domain-containing protein [Methylosinus sp. KRF6]MBU3891064.1 DDE-type integrase/transposase/recombinase [Methylosinus sp. KRF6]
MDSDSTEPQDARQEAPEAREDFLRQLLRRSNWKVTAEIVNIARTQLDIPRSTLFRMASRFRSTRLTSSLAQQQRGTPDGVFRLAPEVEHVIAEQIERFWLRKEKPKFSALMERIRGTCLAEGLHPPHYRTVRRRVMDLTPISAARKRGERDIETAATPSPGQFVASRPNAIWQIDHTVVDVIIVDEQLRRPIGRPVLTIAIDVCTRMVAGFHLSLEAPSSVSVGLCLLHAVYDKTVWLNEREIDISWPVAGLPEVLHCDNGAEFRSRALANACREYGVKLQFRPPATPRFGGHIERLIGTMMGAVHVLPGTTFSNVEIKGDYDAECRATFTLRELEKWIAIEIAGKYHHRIHSALLRPPVAVWRDLQGDVDFDLPPDRMAFWTSFLPEERRRLLKDGIHLEKIRYWSDVLSRDVGRGAEVKIKYDPRDLSRIFVRQPDGHFVEARYRNLAYPPVSWWEWKHAKKRLREQGKRELNEETIFASIAQQRQIEDSAAQASATARRNVTRRPDQPRDDGGKITGVDLAKPGYSNDDMEFWDQ